MEWNPETYNKFRSERKQPFIDCLQLIEKKSSMQIIDLGCGTGELTYELARWMPEPALVAGIDSSAEMLEKSGNYKHDKLIFRQSTIEVAVGVQSWDLIFSHAALQWIDDHQRLFALIIAGLKPGGQLVVQMPSQPRNLTNQLLSDLADSAQYAHSFKNWQRASPVLDAGDYADMLFRHGGENIQVFEKIYPVIVPDVSGLFDWVSGTALIPYLERLSDGIKHEFISDFKAALAKNFPGKPIFYPFKRIIMSAKF